MVIAAIIDEEFASGITRWWNLRDNIGRAWARLAAGPAARANAASILLTFVLHRTRK
jgi:hypothetical protein